MKRYDRILFSAVLLLFLFSISPIWSSQEPITAECTYRDDSVCMISEFVQLVENSLVPSDSPFRQFSFGLSSHLFARLFFFMLAMALLIYVNTCKRHEKAFTSNPLSLFDFFINHPRLAPPVLRAY